MTITIDTSAVIAILNGEPAKAAVLAAIADQPLVAPASLPWEIGNALAAMFKRRVASEADALAALDIFRQMPIDLVDVPLELAIQLASQHQIYAYDAYMLACASLEGGPLLTLDRGLRDAARRASVKLLEVAP